MAARNSSRQPQKRTPARRTTRTMSSYAKKQRGGSGVSLRPEHQRELFALALITIALVTMIFFLTGTTGGFGSMYLALVQEAFGNGALVVPLALGLFGGAILIQERLRDRQLTTIQVFGVLLMITTLLALLEFPVHEAVLAQRVGRGGGLVGYGAVRFLDAIIGRPAAIAVVVMTLLASMLLTFNITLRDMIFGTVWWFHSFWHIIWGTPDEPSHHHTTKTTKTTKTHKTSPSDTTESSVDGDSDDDLEPTPIAARLTRASLFRRDGQPAQSAAVHPPLPPQSTPSAKHTERGVSDTPAPFPHPTESAVATANNATTSYTSPTVAAHHEQIETFDVPTVHLAWPLPHLDMLETPTAGTITHEERQLRSRIIEETLASFKVEARVVGVNTGPVITQFELQPAVGVKVSKITTLEKDLALALAAPSIRIEAPIPGKGVVGIEVPNTAISIVSLREVIDSEQFNLHKGKLKLPLGKDVSGLPVIADMTRMPHLLIAGSTGSGKSVAINTFISGLLLKHTPEELRIIMVDPKMVELIVYNRIPHLLSPVVTELERVVPTLRWATREMERRYKIFARHGCRNLESYQKQAHSRADLEPMPYIVLIIDELADLMMMAPDEVETHLCRLAQMARATGIHLIVATQRPSVDVITGLIKANFPSRVAFAVTSQVDSRVILDVPGAERLLGRGDMLYVGADSAKLIRMQGAYVSDGEVEKIVEFWRKATPPTHNTPTHVLRGTTQRTPQPHAQHRDSQDAPFSPPESYLSDTEQDELLPKAMDLVKQHKRASASLLQRRLRIGYSKAAQLIDLLEQQGIVGPAEDGRSREVFYMDE